MTMNSSWSLRARFLLATSLLTLVLCAVFAFAVHEFVELLEDELLHRTLVHEMQELKTELAENAQAAPPSSSGLSGFIVRTPADLAALPPELRSLSNGVHEDVLIRDHTYFVAVDATAGSRLFLLLDTAHVEALEGSVVTVAVLVGLLALGLSAVIGFALPYFWVGLLLVYIFSVTLGWLPYQDAYNVLSGVPGWNLAYIGDVLQHAILPGMTIIITQIGLWILLMRNNTVTVLAEDYVRMARAKGLKPWRVMWAYAGRNAILPNLTGFAMALGFVVSGAILVEYVFNYPGLGNLLLRAVEGLDFPLMQALFLLITLAVLFSLLFCDVLTALLDPRTRESS